MQYGVLFILLVLITGGLAQAAVFPCSSDGTEKILLCSGGCQDLGIVDITVIPAEADIITNPALSTIKLGKSPLRVTDDLGPHAFTVSLTGYNDYSGFYQICSEKITYVTVHLTPSPTLQSGSVHSFSTLNAVTLKTVPPAPTASTAVPGATSQVITPVPSPITVQGTQAAGTGTMKQPVLAQQTGTALQPDTLGSLSVTTIPAGAAILIDGVIRGASPATIPGIPAGSHTLILKLDGYQDMSTPITIAAGRTQDYSTAMVKNAAAPAVTDTANATPLPKKAASPGFEAALVVVVLGAILCTRK